MGGGVTGYGVKCTIQSKRFENAAPRHHSRINQTPIFALATAFAILKIDNFDYTLPRTFHKVFVSLLIAAAELTFTQSFRRKKKVS